MVTRLRAAWPAHMAYSSTAMEPYSSATVKRTASVSCTDGRNTEEALMFSTRKIFVLIAALPLAAAMHAQNAQSRASWPPGRARRSEEDNWTDVGAGLCA